MVCFFFDIHNLIYCCVKIVLTRPLLLFSMISSLLLLQALAFAHFVASSELPYLNIDGFAWAENLVFDGLGHMFVAENTNGMVYRINLCNNGTEYCKEIYLENGLKKVGGLQVSDDGQVLYAGVTFDDEDESTGIISAPTNGNPSDTYSIFAKTAYQPNGLAYDITHGYLYYAASDIVYAVNKETQLETVIRGGVKGADGAWFNPLTNKLYIGELFSMQIHVFDTANPITNLGIPASYVGVYTALSNEFGKTHMMDDFTIQTQSIDTTEVEDVYMYGCDFTGKNVMSFDMSGKHVSQVDLNKATDGQITELFNPTSVRYGKGEGFDPSSLYLAEGGGITKRTTNRRVIQLKV